MWPRHSKRRPHRSEEGAFWRTPLGGTLYRAGFQFGDTIVVTDHKTPWVNGLWVVKDKMAHSKKIDFLVHRSKGHTFRNSTCTIRKKLEGEVIPAYTEDEKLD